MLDDLYEKVSDLYDSIEEIALIKDSSIFRNEAEIFINDAYRNAISNICGIPVEDITYDMIEMARNYIIYEDVNGFKKGRHLSNEELKKEINLMRGNVSEVKTNVNDRIGTLYNIVSDNMTHLRELGMPEDEVFIYMNQLTKDIYKNTISEITGVNPIAIPDDFVYNIASCVKYDENGDIVVDRYTDEEIKAEVSKRGLDKQRIFVFPGEYNHALAGKIEKLDYACRNHYIDLKNFGIRQDDLEAFMNNLTLDIYRNTIAEVVEVPASEISDELVATVREGKTSLDGSKKSYLDNEVRLLYAFNTTKNKTI